MKKLISKLEDYYRHHGIDSMRFDCAHRSSCSANCENFTEAKASLVGEDYGDPIRIVVLSLDPGSGWVAPRERTFEAVAEMQSNLDPDAIPKHKHWYRTHETVAALLSCMTDRDLATRDITDRFAHVNAAKCSHNLPNRKQAPAHLFKNCRPYLEGELAILAPDVVITQGKRAAKVVEPLKKRSRSKNVIGIGHRDAYWLELVHPTAWGGAYGEEKKTWPRRFARVRKWVEAR